MKLMLFGIFLCICALQVFGIGTYWETKRMCKTDPIKGDLTLPEFFNYNRGITAVRDLSDQAAEDFRNESDCLLRHIIYAYTYELLRDKLAQVTRGADLLPVFYNDSLIDGVPELLNNEIINDIETTPRLNPAKKKRLITYVKGFSRGTTIDEVKATLSYLYGFPF